MCIIDQCVLSWVWWDETDVGARIGVDIKKNGSRYRKGYDTFVNVTVEMFPNRTEWK